MSTLRFLWRCIFYRHLCPWHSVSYQYRIETVDGPMSGYYCCDHDYQTVEVQYCPICEES